MTTRARLSIAFAVCGCFALMAIASLIERFGKSGAVVIAGVMLAGAVISGAVAIAFPRRPL